MASDIFSVRPPAWLENLTRPSEPGMAGKVLGELVGGMAIAAQQAKGDMEKAESKGEDATWLGSWFKAVPRGIHETRLNVSDPMWRLKAQQAELGMASTALQMQTQLQQIDMNKTKLRLNAEDTAAIPKWLQEHPTVESRIDAEWPTAKTREWNDNLDQLRLRDSQSNLSKARVTGLKDLSDAVTSISLYDGVKAAELSAKIQPFAVKGQMPPPELTAQVMAARSEAETKKFERSKELFRARGTGFPIGQKYLALADQEDELAEDFRSKGDAVNYQAHKDRANTYRELAQPKISQTELSMDPSGKVVMTETRGPSGTKPTSSTTSLVQQKNIAYSNALQGISDVLAKVRPEDIGIAGVVGENVFDTWVEQLQPGTANRERISNRTALRGLRENLFAALSPERLSGSAFSNKDVERLKELTSNLEASTSYAQFKERLGTIQGLIKERIRTNASALGEPAPDSVKTLPELQSEYNSQISAINKMLTENRLTKEQAQERINALVERIRTATRQNFGIANPFE